MSTCRNCDVPLLEDDAYCHKCGVPVVELANSKKRMSTLRIVIITIFFTIGYIVLKGLLKWMSLN